MLNKYVDANAFWEKLLSKCEEDWCDLMVVYELLNGMPSVDVAAIKTLYGYNLKDFLLFAIACRNAGITDGDLRVFANSMDFAWKSIQADTEKTFEYFMRELIAERRTDGEIH